MIRDEYLRRLVDAAHVDLYLSGMDGARIYWPWRMEPVHEATVSYRNACEHYIVDSSFNNPDITNKDALDKAHEIGAEMVVLEDVYQDFTATVNRVLEGLELADDHPFEGDIMVPLQAPHDECYAELSGGGDAYAIGGVKDAMPKVKVSAVQRVREVAGDDVHLHGLGFGPTDAVVKAVRENPNLIDSVDYSTPVQNAMTDSTAPGEERKSVVAARAAATLIEDLRKVSTFTSEPEPENQTLEAFANA